MLYIGRISAPLLLLHASMAASKLGDLRTNYLRALASTIVRLQNQGATLRYLSSDRRSMSGEGPVLDIIFDGATASRTNKKGHERHLIRRRFGDIVHPVQSSARRLRRMACISSTAETWAAVDAMSNGLYFKALLADISAPS